MKPRVSIVLGVTNASETVEVFLDRLFEAVSSPCEVLAVFDDSDDRVERLLTAYAAREERVRPTRNTYGSGVARALRCGIEHAEAHVIVVTHADGSDDPRQIDQLTSLVERGVVVAAASWYMDGGQLVGGPFLRSLLSRLADLSLHWFARVGTHDATNLFKGYDRDFVRTVGIEADVGYELGIEMVAKARRHRLAVAEVPTIWLDCGAGPADFQMLTWIPRDLRWYRYAFGPSLRSTA